MAPVAQVAIGRLLKSLAEKPGLAWQRAGPTGAAGALAAALGVPGAAAGATADVGAGPASPR